MSAPKLEGVRLVWSQEGDCCDEQDFQELTVETQDGGGGHFVVFSTRRWALDDDAAVDALAQRLKDALRLVETKEDA